MRRDPTIKARVTDGEKRETVELADALGVKESDLIRRGRELAANEARAKIAQAEEDESNRDQENVRRQIRGLAPVEQIKPNDVRQEVLAERQAVRSRVDRVPSYRSVAGRSRMRTQDLLQPHNWRPVGSD